MAKIYLKTSLKTKEEETPIIYEGFGMIHDGKIVYQENEVTTIIQNRGKEYTLTRKNAEYELHFSFALNEDTSGHYHIFAVGPKMHLQIHTNVLEWNNHEIEILYQLRINDVDMGEYLYHLEYEVKE